MKHLLLACFFLGFAWSANTQVMVDSVDINKLDIQYIELYAASGIGSSVRINYGQADNKIMIYFDPLIDPQTEKPFRNTIAALNFLYRNGWELVLPSFRSGDEEQPTYMLQRRERGEK